MTFLVTKTTLQFKLSRFVQKTFISLKKILIPCQESSQLRRKVEELENNYEASKKQVKELQEKVKQSTKQQGTLKGKLPTFMSKTSANDKEIEKKLKDFDKEIIDLKKQILDKDKLIKDLQTKETNLKYPFL